jgi:enoyl-CoA hydratase/carnithine racemase
MSGLTVEIEIEPPLATVALNDPSRRNAMTLAMFDALDAGIACIAADDSVRVVLLKGNGGVFCAGFDLTATQRDTKLLGTFIIRLSSTLRAIRRLPQIVVAAVNGGAIAGGCALLSACDFVFVSATAKVGYPVHRIGISPAVAIPTLQLAIGSGAARALLMSGELLNGSQAHQLGIATHLSASDEAALADARQHCQALAGKGVEALRATKRWLNELDGSLDDAKFDAAARDSARLSNSREAASLLAKWKAS